MAGTVIRTKYSTTTAVPSNDTLALSEMAYSFSSDQLFIGEDTGGSIVARPIGGYIPGMAAATLADADLISFYDDTDGRYKKSTADGLRDFVLGGITGDVTINASGVSTIGSGAVDFGMLNAAFVITQAESITSNDNDTSIPTSAAVKDYVDSVAGSSTLAGLTDTNITSPADGSLLVYDSGNTEWIDAARLTISLSSFNDDLTYDNYVSWSVNVNSAGADAIGSGETLAINNGTAISLAYASNTLTVNHADVTTMTMSTVGQINPGGDGVDVVSGITVNSQGHVTAVSTTTYSLGTIRLGIDTSGNYVNDVIDGTGIAVSHTVVPLTGGEGSKATVTLKNAASLTDDRILLWDDANGQVSNSSIGDDGDGVITINSSSATPTIRSSTSTLILDPSGYEGAGSSGSATGTVIVAGDLVVNGTTTTVNSTTVDIGDSIILLNSNETGPASQNAGFEVERGTDDNVTFRWSESDGGLFEGKVLSSPEAFTKFKGLTFESTQATGTAPFTVASTTAVTNLNADLLDGQHGSHYLNIANATGTLNIARIADGSITNAKLANDSITLGLTTITLGAAATTTVTGLTSVSSTTFVGDLTGNADTADDISGGAANQVVYQSGANSTAFLATTNSATAQEGTFLAQTGTSLTPVWTNVIDGGTF